MIEWATSVISDVCDFITNGVKMLLASWQIKTACSVIFVYCYTLLKTYAWTVISNKHIVVLLAFIGLVFIDLATKLIALAAQRIADNTKRPIEDIPTISKLWGIPVAMNSGIIKSKFMRDKFLTKMLTYLLAVFSAGLVDQILAVTNNNSYVLNFMYFYLASTEFLSIMENLRDGGNTMVGNFVDLAKNKILSRLK